MFHNNPTQVFVGANSDFLMKQNSVTGYDPWASTEAWKITPSSAWMLLTYSFYVSGATERFLHFYICRGYTALYVMTDDHELWVWIDLERVSLALFQKHNENPQLVTQQMIQTRNLPNISPDHYHYTVLFDAG